MKLDLSLENRTLYEGLAIQRLAGRLTLVSAPDEAIDVLCRNLRRMEIDPEDVTLTGSMAIWAYLVVFHYLHGRTKRIHYEDGKGNRILVAAHG